MEKNRKEIPGTTTFVEKPKIFTFWPPSGGEVYSDWNYRKNPDDLKKGIQPMLRTIS